MLARNIPGLLIATDASALLVVRGAPVDTNIGVTVTDRLTQYGNPLALRAAEEAVVVLVTVRFTVGLAERDMMY